ncbi:MAG: TetR/AcrR family transcriptional regulator, partial [Gammaproteobacteria bacterium]|nr:TetR/AcrR family transcriptional regulator [Gammaproteobacteria bacterium]
AKDARRQRIVQAALDEFFERGFSAARMDDIAERAGLSKGRLYLYFQTTESLFDALIDTIALPRVAQMEHISQEAGSATQAIYGLCALAPEIIRHSPMPKIIKILIGDGNRFPAVVARYRQQVIERGLGALEAVLERGHQRGELNVPHPALTARLVIAPVILSAIWQVVFENPEDTDKVDLDTLFALHRDTLLQALSVVPGGQD